MLGQQTAKMESYRISNIAKKIVLMKKEPITFFNNKAVLYSSNWPFQTLFILKNSFFVLQTGHVGFEFYRMGSKMIWIISCNKKHQIGSFAAQKTAFYQLMVL